MPRVNALSVWFTVQTRYLQNLKEKLLLSTKRKISNTSKVTFSLVLST